MDRPQSFSQCVEYFNTAAGPLPEMILTGTYYTVLTNVLLIYYTIVCSYSMYVYLQLTLILPFPHFRFKASCSCYVQRVQIFITVVDY